MTESIQSFLTAWANAERAADIAQLDAMLTADFYGVGPLGFVLPKPAWLARHRQGDLVYQAFELDEIQIRELGGVAVVTARNNTLGSYRGQPIPEAVRATLVLVSESGGWLLTVIHMSFIGGTSGAPPIPGQAD